MRLCSPSQPESVHPSCGTISLFALSVFGKNNFCVVRKLSKYPSDPVQNTINGLPDYAVS